MLEQAGLRRPAADAVVDGPRRLTYADLVDQATRLGHAFARLGVGKGDRVLIVLKNRLEHVLAYWALRTIGGVPTPAGFRLAAREVRYILDDCEASVVLFEATTAAAVLEAVAGHQARLVFVGDGGPPGCLPFAELLASGGAAVDRHVAEGDLSLILYTSGTTGRPKGVPRTHKNHVAGALAHVIQCGYGWLERTLGVMPLYHTMGILARHPLVRDVAVVGEPDERWGEQVVAFVVPAARALTADTLDQHCRECPDLANFKRPRKIVFVSEIPKTASGKILRRLLREGQYTEVQG